MNYLLIAIVLFLLELIYFKIADKYNIIDKPNSRSSHSIITIRGGGIIFAIAILMAYMLNDVSWPITLAVVLIAVVSLIDDIKPLSHLPRFGTQFIVFLLVIYDLNLLGSDFWVLPVILVLIIGWINAFNFMDGINGITVLYALTAIVSFSFLPIHKNNMSLLIIMGLSCIVFGFFNVRAKAKTFAGDVGSISMALFLGYFMLKTIIETGQIGYLLFFCVYGIDAVVTIFTRIKKKENILESHRSHLYQFLANEMEYPHVFVSVIYAVLQLLINVLVLYLDTLGVLSPLVAVLILLILGLIYLVIRNIVVRKVTLIAK